MDWVQVISDVLGLIVGGGMGALIMQVYTARENKQKLAKEVEGAQADIERKKQDNKQDAFETMYQELNKCMEDYTALSESYREHREKTRKYEETIQDTIRDKCNELAAMKSKIIYLKGIRCYDTLCRNRIREHKDTNGGEHSDDSDD